MKKALIVGINDYPKAKLHGCINDAKAIRDSIENNGNGSPNFDVKLIENVATKSELMRHVKDLFSGGCDTELFYFSGHGFFDKYGGGKIVTPDYKKDDEGVSMHEILKIANKSKSDNRVIILDCCHSGSFGSPTNEDGNMAEIAEGVSILTSSKADEVSVEVKGHGIFTRLLLDALAGGAADLRGHITPGSIYSYIDQSLGPWKQRPVFKTNITRFNSIKEVIPQVAPDVIRKLPTYFSTTDYEFSLDPSFEKTNNPQVAHKLVEPYAKEEKVEVFTDLQKLASVGLVVPIEEQHMYFAAMHSKSCKLTNLGQHYWRLVNDKRV